MASLKDMRVRIASTKATQKITKAMQMVAASKLRRAQTAAEAARPYAEKRAAVISNIATAAAGSPGGRALLAGTGRDQVHLLLVCTGERGLSGAFNSSIVRLARERALSLMNQGKEGKFFCGGRKGFEQLRRNFERQIVENVELRSVRQLGFVNAEDVAKKVLARFDAGEFDVCTLFYSRFKSVIAQVPPAQQIIPLVVEAPAANAGPATAYEYEPEEDEILTGLLPRNLAVQIFRALLENNASFYGAQMSAMDNATRNAGDMIRKQTLIYNRTRQAMITKELIEIISGAEAISSPHGNRRRAMAYVTSATTKGGRNGRAMLDNGALALAMAAPKEIGGAGDGHNPEQLFALGYSSCYGQAITVIAKKYGLDGQAARVTCEVTLDQKDGGFGLAVELKVSIPGADKDKLQQLVEEAHTVCPYSKATKGNIPVKLTVV